MLNTSSLSNAEIVGMNGQNIWTSLKMKTDLKDLDRSYGACPCGQNAAAKKIFNLIQDLFCEGADNEDED
jgi:hypothetical protein